jgi:hypothetical protein
MIIVGGINAAAEEMVPAYFGQDTIDGTIVAISYVEPDWKYNNFCLLQDAHAAFEGKPNNLHSIPTIMRSAKKKVIVLDGLLKAYIEDNREKYYSEIFRDNNGNPMYVGFEIKGAESYQNKIVTRLRAAIKGNEYAVSSGKPARDICIAFILNDLIRGRAVTRTIAAGNSIATGFGEVLVKSGEASKFVSRATWEGACYTGNYTLNIDDFGVAANIAELHPWPLPVETYVKHFHDNVYKNLWEKGLSAEDSKFLMDKYCYGIIDDLAYKASDPKVYAECIQGRSVEGAKVLVEIELNKSFNPDGKHNSWTEKRDAITAELRAKGLGDYEYDLMADLNEYSGYYDYNPDVASVANMEI